jgi:hypothetical protein
VRKEDPMRPMRKLVLVLFVAVGIVTTVAPDILAVVGRPLTPVSVAGVARRTARRTTRRNIYY